MSNYFPEDCWPEVLKWLPVKSLARFRCVCRGWNALICSSSFIADHLDCSKSKPRLFINEIYHSEEKSCVIFDSDSSSAATYIPHIMPTAPRSYKFVGSAKGIICFYVGDVYSVMPIERCDIVLWNPMIKKYIKLPDGAPTHSRVSLAIAIGAKPSEADDLRILRVSSNFSDRWTSAATVAEIYSVRQGEWRVLHTNTPRRSYVEAYSGLKPYFNGGVHWIVSEYCESPYQLISFGFEEEEFSYITLPDVLADSRHSALDVGAYCGKLALFHRHDRLDSTLRIWTRDGAADSWSVIISIGPLDFRYSFIQYGITHDGQILMLRRKDYHVEVDDVLGLYDPTSASFRRLNMQASSAEEDGLGACEFVESLVFMDGEGGALNLPLPL